MPEEVLLRLREEMMNWKESGMSVLELPHRGSYFQEILDETAALGAKLLGLPSSHSLVFMQGGARAQNALIPLNLLGEKKKCDYLITGLWSEVSAKEARKYGEVGVVASIDASPLAIPPMEEWVLDKNACYLHFCSNETVQGVEVHDWPTFQKLSSKVPMVVDVSSNIFTRQLDFSETAIAYAGAQKNTGPAGVTLVVLNKNFLEKNNKKKHKFCPSVFDYSNVLENNSCFNTPPTLAIFITKLMFEWIEKLGGVEKMEWLNRQKADRLYNFLDESSFYSSNVKECSRSRVNIPFFLPSNHLMKPFLLGAREKGLLNLQGHKLTGGLRASLYNSMPLEGVNKLVHWLIEFEKQFS
tara:strand:- start:80575 stop:81639 length:1065 start_codon:yes stop_codon:yes gene_type:complete